MIYMGLLQLQGVAKCVIVGTFGTEFWITQWVDDFTIT